RASKRALPRRRPVAGPLFRARLAAARSASRPQPLAESAPQRGRSSPRRSGSWSESRERARHRRCKPPADRRLRPASLARYASLVPDAGGDPGSRGGSPPLRTGARAVGDRLARRGRARACASAGRRPSRTSAGADDIVHLRPAGCRTVFAAPGSRHQEPGKTRGRGTIASGVSVLRTIEQKIEALVEGVFGRAFRTNVQPVELARKLAKEMDDHRTVSVSRVYVPNEYTVYLSPPDHEQFAGYEESLKLELKDYLVEHARREGYVMLTEPVVLMTT